MRAAERLFPLKLSDGNELTLGGLTSDQHKRIAAWKKNPWIYEATNEFRTDMDVENPSPPRGYPLPMEMFDTKPLIELTTETTFGQLLDSNTELRTVFRKKCSGSIY